MRLPQPKKYHWAAIPGIEVMQLDSQFLLAILPPGAFIALGILIAIKNVIDMKLKEREVVDTEKVIERVRVNFDS